MSKILNFLKAPPLYARIISYVSTILFTSLTVVLLVSELNSEFWEVLRYFSYALAAISLSYTVYLLIVHIPKARRNAVEFLNGFAFTKKLLSSYGFRTVIFSIGSFVFSVAFGIFNGYLGIAHLSIWYGALAAYYIFLALMRGGILVHHSNNFLSNGERENIPLKKAKTYLNCGLILLILNVVLSSAIAQIIFSDEYFSYASWTIYAFAFYAFFKIITSIINLIKSQDQEDLTVKAIRNLNLTDACVSILALQTALLNVFSTGEVDVSFANTLTGIAVSATALTIAVLMTIRGLKEIKLIKSEKN